MKDKKVYCPTCERMVLPRRKNFDHKYHELIFFFVCLTFGLGYIIYLILKYKKKKDTCPYCERKLNLETPLKAPP
ncbi:MAG: hypothetical protein GF311_07980 [Candidatus Lokiarchaeota archaeon]|nr:hypothetical protein [Candidatus Lokiarchaeota archaeon]